MVLVVFLLKILAIELKHNARTMSITHCTTLLYFFLMVNVLLIYGKKKYCLAYIFTSTAPRLPKLYAFLVMAVKLLSTKIVGNTSMLPTGQTKEGTDKNFFLVSSS